MSSKIAFVTRVLQGLIFFVFGLNGFLNFLPMPPMAPEAMNFFTAMMATGYFFPVLKGTEVLAGLLLLSNRFVPLALILLAPIVVQICLFHTFVEKSGLPMALALVVLEAVNAYFRRDAFRDVLRA